MPLFGGRTTMFLSRLILNPRHNRTQSELAHPYEMHRTICKAWESIDSERILWRAESDQPKSVNVLVQSLTAPDWSRLQSQKGYLMGIDGPKQVDFTGLQSGQVLRFRLRANPTKRIHQVTKGSEDLKGKRVGLLRESEQIDWLMRKGMEREKGAPGGFEILTKEVRGNGGDSTAIPRLEIRNEGKVSGLKRKENNRHRMTHLAVRFDGLLRVTDTDAFRETLRCGIGTAKSFGFGLLSIALVKG